VAFVFCFSEHLACLKRTFPKFKKNEKWLREKQNKTFAKWIRDKVEQLPIVPKIDCILGRV
jgi:hypothetical protein